MISLRKARSREPPCSAPCPRRDVDANPAAVRVQRGSLPPISNRGFLTCDVFLKGLRCRQVQFHAGGVHRAVGPFENH